MSATSAPTLNDAREHVRKHADNTADPEVRASYGDGLRRINTSRDTFVFPENGTWRAGYIYAEIIRAADTIVMVTTELDGKIMYSGGVELFDALADAIERKNVRIVVRNEVKTDNDLSRWLLSKVGKGKGTFELLHATQQMHEATRITAKDNHVVGYFDFIVGNDDMYRIEEYTQEGSGEYRLHQSFNAFQEPEAAKDLVKLFDGNAGNTPLPQPRKD